MYGLVFEILEEFVLEKQPDGRQLWHLIKEQAGCKLADHGFLRRSHYEDGEIMRLLRAASRVLNTPMDDLLISFGKFMIHHHYHNGYNELLRANGATLRQWLSNLNAMHNHVAKSFPQQEIHFQAPMYWCEDDEQVEASILLHYYSFRGTALVPMTEGIVQELAQFQFGVEVTLTQLALQGVDDAEFTTWRITAVNPSMKWKLSPTVDMDDVIDFSQMELPAVCPYSGRTLGGSSIATSSFGDHDDERDPYAIYEQFQSIFPFHVLVDRYFTILQVGQSLPEILSQTEDTLVGSHVGDVLDIIRPVMGKTWDWQALKKLEDQHFWLIPSTSKRNKSPGGRRRQLKKSQSTIRRQVSMEGARIKFQGSMIEMNSHNTSNTKRQKRRDDTTVVMLVLSPDARNVMDLRQMGLTMDDLPLHTSQRDVVFLGEYIAQEVDMANNLDKLSKKLELEKNLSTTLLYNMLPKQIADDLRNGSTVEPQHHDKVTLFFSDVVGFTNICDKVDPWAVIDLLNQLYSIMDYCATEFNLYKVETIGDAYMCCSGLPEADEYHAENIANFAICVMECVKHVRSPVDGTPIQLRVGIHTGSCTAGVVGTLTPHYCLFGDMVNVASRHESTGLAGTIQCSSELFDRLMQSSNFEEVQFKLVPRGLVNMKGKGDRMTYFLQEGTMANKRAGPAALKKIYNATGAMMKKQDWKKIRRSGLFVGSSSSVVSISSRKTVSTVDTTESGYQSTGHPEHIESPLELEDSSHSSSGSPQVCPFNNVNAPLDVSSDELQNLVFDNCVSHESLVTSVHSILSPLLHFCLSGNSDNETERSLREKQLYAFVSHVSSIMKRQNNAYHNFRRTAHVVVWANHLFKQVQDGELGQNGTVDTGAWFRFALLMAALLRDCKHTGISETQLQDEEHTIYKMHGGDHCQARYGYRYGLDVLADNFQRLYDDIVLGFPLFLYIMKKLETHQIPAGGANGKKLNETLTSMGTILRMASLGHFALDTDNFFKWNEAAFAELRLANLANRGADPSPVWNEECVRFMRKKVLALVSDCEKLLPHHSSDNLRKAVAANLKKFETRVTANHYPRRGLDASDRSINHIAAAVEVFR